MNTLLRLGLLATLLGAAACGASTSEIGGGDGDGGVDTDAAPVDLTDTDGDTITDQQENKSFDVDTDDDGTPDYQDLDSDGDCIPDAIEAGDDVLTTAPQDTDGDSLPDFMDRDSDNDGLSDAAEDPNCDGIVDDGETSSTSDDTDGDGVSDLVEDVAGTDPNDATDNPASHGDFFFLMPYQAPADPNVDTLEFRTSVQFADIYFSIDTTGSMDAEIAALSANSGIPTIVNDLTCNVIGGVCALDNECATGVCFGNTCIEDPGLGAGCVPDLYSGVATFDELNTFRNLQSLQADPAVTANAVPNGTGGGSAEAPIQSALCVADGVGCTSPVKNCAASGIGCPGFRDNAVRILIQVTDADDQCNGGGCPTMAQAGAAMMAAGVNFIGLYGSGDEGGEGTAQSISNDLGVAAGTLDVNGNTFNYPATNSAVVDQTKAAVLDIVQNLPLNTTIAQSEEPGDDGDALPFIDYVEVNVNGTGNCTNVMDTADTDADTRPDAFPTLRPGTPVCWDVHPIASNTTIQATDSPLVFIATLTVNGDGSPLDSRKVFFLVPPVLDNIEVD